MENNVDTIIGLNVTLKGNLHNKGSIQINGAVEGEVKSEENVLVGDTAKIKGPVIAKVIEISGEVSGIVEASERLEINPTGKVYGDINAKTLIIKEGATFIGSSAMPKEHKEAVLPASEPTKEIKEVKVEKPEESIKEPAPVPTTADKFGFFKK